MMRGRSSSQKVLHLVNPAPILHREWVTFQKTADNTPHRYLLQLVEDRLEFKEYTEKDKAKYAIHLRNIGHINCVESTIIIKHLKVKKLELNNWILTYMMMRNAHIARTISKVVEEAMMSNKFPHHLDLRDNGEDKKVPTTTNNKSNISRSLSQGNYQTKSNQKLTTKSLGPDENTAKWNTSSNRKSLNLTNEKSTPQETKSLLNSSQGHIRPSIKESNVPIRRTATQGKVQTRPRSKTQNQSPQTLNPTQQIRTKSQNSSENKQIVIKKRHSTFVNPSGSPIQSHQTEEAPSLSKSLQNPDQPSNIFPSEVNNQSQNLSLGCSNPFPNHSSEGLNGSPNPFIVISDNYNPFDNFSAISLSQSTPVNPNTSFITTNIANNTNPFLTPEFSFNSNINNGVVANGTPENNIFFNSNNPFLQNF